MEPGRARNVWLRMTDAMGLTEPGKKPQRQSPKMLLFLTVLWSLSAVVWLVQVVRDVSMGASDYYWKVVLAVLFFVLAIAYCGNVAELEERAVRFWGTVLAETLT